MRSRLGLTLLVVATCACRVSPDAPPDALPPDAAPLFDAPDGTGCTVTTPRLVDPEVFVGPTGLEDRLVALIDSAQHSLALQMYLFDDTVLRDHIIEAHDRGVAVRVLLDPQERANLAIKSMFLAHGLEARDTPAVYTYSHAKYLVIDSAEAVIMSMNFNTGAMTSERNYGFIDRDPEDVADVVRIFTMDWALAGDTGPRPANLACTRLLVSPVNSMSRVLDLIKSAQHTLDVEAMYVNQTGVRIAIVQAAQRGVAVRVILETPNEQAGNDAAAAYFASVGVPSKYATDAQFFLHAKLVLADGVAFIGSENYSDTSLTANREVGALVFEPAAAAIAQTQFDADWAATASAP